jgi:hypothetical protein
MANLSSKRYRFDILGRMRRKLLPRLRLDDFIQNVRLGIFPHQMRIALAFVIIHFIDAVVFPVFCQ